MRYKYEFEADEDFEKGCCDSCPLTYDEETQWGWDTRCVFHASYRECPLEEVEE